MYINDNGKFVEAIAFWDSKVNEEKIKDVDVIFYIHILEPKAKYFYEFYTLEHDLKDINEEKLFSQYKSNLRNDLRQANKQEFKLTFLNDPTTKELEEFIEIYNSFAEFKKLSKISDSFLKKIAADKKLAISYVEKDGEILTVHSHYVANGRARLYHSASTNNSFDAKTNGLANKFLTHNDFLHFSKTCEVYDMGGVGDSKHGTKPFEGIIRFKSAFGGEHVTHYKGVTPVGENGQKIYDKYWK